MKNDKLDLLACRCTYWNGKIYCLARNFNLLFSVDLQNEKTELVDVVPEGNILTSYLCGAINVWNDKLILTPNHTKKIWIYDLISRHWESLTIKDYDHWGTGGIFQTHIYNNKMFLVGGSYPAILRLDLDDNSCDYIEEPYKEVIARHPDINHHYFRTHGVRSENKLYLASALDNFVLEFDMTTCEHHWFKVGNDKYMYSGIAWDGEHFWLSPRLTGDIVKWDGKNSTKIIPLPNEFKQHTQTYIWEVCYDGEQVVFPSPIPAPPKKSIRIDPKNDNIQFFDQYYPVFVRLDNNMVISQTIDGDLSVTTESSLRKTYHTTIGGDQLKQFYKERNLSVFNGQTLYHEIPGHPLLSLESFLEFTESRDESVSDGQIGKKIWDHIR